MILCVIVVLVCSSPSEWDKLAEWVVDNRLFHYNVRWMIQIPRLYRVYKAANTIKTFGEMLSSTHTHYSCTHTCTRTHDAARRRMC